MDTTSDEQLKQNLLDAARNLRAFQISEIRALRVLRALVQKQYQAGEETFQASRALGLAQEAFIFADFGFRTLLEEKANLGRIGDKDHPWKTRGHARDSLMLSCVNEDEDAIVQAALVYADKHVELKCWHDLESRLEVAIKEAGRAAYEAREARDKAQERFDNARAAAQSASEEVDAARAALPSRNIDADSLHDAVQAAALALKGVPYESYNGYYSLEKVVLPGDEEPAAAPGPDVTSETASTQASE